jgi:hypothetical protein
MRGGCGVRAAVERVRAVVQACVYAVCVGMLVLRAVA